MLDNNLSNTIREFEILANKGNELLKSTYKITTSPLLAKRQGLIPPSGTINTLEGVLIFKFHGQGCRLDFNGIVVDFDYSFDDYKYEGFNAYKLYDFYKCISNNYKSFDEFHTGLLELEKHHIITRRDPTSDNTYDFYTKI